MKIRCVAYIAALCLVVNILCGCQMKKENTDSDDAGSDVDTSMEIITVENDKGDTEKILSQFVGVTLDEALKDGADYEDDGSIMYTKGTVAIDYCSIVDGFGPHLIYEDEYEMAASQSVFICRS